MQKFTSFCLIGLSLLSAAVFAEETTKTTDTTMTTTTTTTDANANAPMWHGEFYNITPKRADVTVEWCQAHVLNTYQTTANMVDKEVKADNGIMAKNIKHNSREQGGIVLTNGTATFSGMIDGKEWTDKVYYFGQSLAKKDMMEQGAWYTKDCKGFYKVGPA